MAFSTFVFDTLDVSHAPRPLHRAGALRLDGPRRARWPARCSRVALPLCLLSFGGPGPMVQVLDALRRLEPAARRADAAVDHGLAARSARRRIAFTLLPMLLRARDHAVGAGQLALANLAAAQGFDVALVNALAAAALIALALFLVSRRCCGCGRSGAARSSRRAWFETRTLGGPADVRGRFRIQRVVAGALAILSALAVVPPAAAARRVLVVSPTENDARIALVREAIVYWNGVFAELKLEQPLIEAGVVVKPAGVRAIENFAWQISRLAGRLPDGMDGPQPPASSSRSTPTSSCCSPRSPCSRSRGP